MDSATIEIIKLMAVALGGGAVARFIDYLIARREGTLKVTLNDRDELRKFIDEGREREKTSLQREAALEAKVDFLVKENTKLNVEIALLQQEKKERDQDIAHMRESWARERDSMQREWALERASLQARITELETQVKALKHGQNNGR